MVYPTDVRRIFATWRSWTSAFGVVAIAVTLSLTATPMSASAQTAPPSLVGEFPGQHSPRHHHLSLVQSKRDIEL
jgi:Spy/CpxP family protein refolding chaperone